MIDSGHSVQGCLSMSVKVICCQLRGNGLYGKKSWACSTVAAVYHVYCAQFLFPASYIPLQETMKILDLMQDRTEIATDCVVPQTIFRYFIRRLFNSVQLKRFPPLSAGRLQEQSLLWRSKSHHT